MIALEPTFPWEGETASTTVVGFKVCTINLEFNLGYSLYPQGVLLLCLQKVGTGDMTLWRRFWTPRSSALESAENLVAETVDYLDALGAVERPWEDLGPDDFLEHLRLNLLGQLH